MCNLLFLEEVDFHVFPRVSRDLMMQKGLFWVGSLVCTASVTFFDEFLDRAVHPWPVYYRMGPLLSCIHAEV